MPIPDDENAFLVLTHSNLVVPNLRRPGSATGPTLRLIAGSHAKLGAHAVSDDGTPVTPENNMYGVADVWNPDAAYAVEDTYVQQGEHTVLAATQGNVTLVNGDAVPASTAAVDTTGIDAGTAVVAPEEEVAVFQLNSSFASMAHALAYQAFAPSAIASFNVFETTDTTPDTIANGAIATFWALGNHAARSQIMVSSPAISAWEFLIVAKNPSAVLFCGYFSEGPGPAFDPAVSGGGPNSSGYRSDGTIFGFGSNVPGFATWGIGDYIGVVYNTTSGQVTFFKNGVLQGASTAADVNGFYLCGVMAS